MRKAAKVLDAHGLVSIYKGFVRPVLEYSPLVWSGAAPTHLSSLDKVHRALKIIGGETVLQSLRLRRTVSALSYLFFFCFVFLLRNTNLPKKIQTERKQQQ